MNVLQTLQTSLLLAQIALAALKDGPAKEVLSEVVTDLQSAITKMQSVAETDVTQEQLESLRVTKLW